MLTDGMPGRDIGPVIAGMKPTRGSVGNAFANLRARRRVPWHCCREGLYSPFSSRREI